MLIIYLTKERIMPDQTLPEIMEVQLRNKAIKHQKTQDAISKIHELLQNFSKRQLIEMIEREADNG
jgi:flagellar biogenesis protein FliO